MYQLLKEIADVGAGQGAPQDGRAFGKIGMPFIRAGNLVELLMGKDIEEIQKIAEDTARKYKLKVYPKGTVLFAKSGMSCLKGYVYVLPCNAYVVNHLACIVPREDFSLYLRYYFNYHKPNQLVKDEAYPSISLSDIGNLKIDVKSKEQREHIVKILNTIKDIITIRKKEIEILDTLVNARFVEMFGDPVTNTKYLALKDLKDVLVLKAGDFTAASDISNEITETHRYPCYGGNGIRGYVSEYNQEGEYSLIGRQGALSGNIQFAKGRFKNTEHALLVMPIIEMNSIWLNQVLINMELKRYQSGAAQPGLSVKNLQEVKIIIVPMEEQNAFADFVNQVDKSKFHKDIIFDFPERNKKGLIIRGLERLVKKEQKSSLIFRKRKEFQYSAYTGGLWDD